MSGGELLLEIRAEEIPARMLPDAVRELATRLFEELVKRGLTPPEMETGFTPRRLWLVLKDVPLKEADRSVEEIGPPVSVAFDADGKPTPAALGFAKKFGHEVGSLGRKSFPKGGERVFLEVGYEGRATRDILAELLPSLLRGLSWPKAMKWGEGVGPWVRPVHGVVAIFAGEIVPFELFGVSSGRTTAGHPILSPAPIDVHDAAEWRRALAELGIVVSPDERVRRLGERMTERAREAGGTLVDDPELLAKLGAICEIPGVMEGSFDEALLDLPREVLATSLRDHQSALTVERDGRLLPMFLTVMDRPDDPAGRVRAGNEWVVAARLADARFFWEKDRTRPLAARVDELDQLAFQERLGSYAEKTERIGALSSRIAEHGGADAGQARRAARLAKADLVTEMVREFTSLQGVMGGIYARQDGEAEGVWQAVYDQYRPASSDDALPRGAIGRSVALADRIDTLVGFFSLGPKYWPSGSRDPFGLRRAAMGVVRLSIEGGLELDLPAVLRTAVELYGDRSASWTDSQRESETRQRDAKKRAAAVEWDPRHALAGATPLSDFLWDRAEYLLGLAGLAYDEIDAARGATGLRETLAFREALARAHALQGARSDASFLSVVLSAKRIANISKDQPAGTLDPEALALEAERSLLAAAQSFEGELDAALGRHDPAAGFAAIAKLAPTLETFFDEVLVMDPDEAKRVNRLALLQRLHASILKLADLSQLAVDKSEYR